MTQPQTDTALAQEVLRLAEQPGLSAAPWRLDESLTRGGPELAEYEIDDANGNLVLRCNKYPACAKYPGCGGDPLANARFIAYCRQAAPDLARRLLASEQRVESLGAEVDAACTECERLRATLSERERELAEAKARMTT